MAWNTLAPNPSLNCSALARTTSGATGPTCRPWRPPRRSPPTSPPRRHRTALQHWRQPGPPSPWPLCKPGHGLNDRGEDATYIRRTAVLIVKECVIESDMPVIKQESAEINCIGVRFSLDGSEQSSLTFYDLFPSLLLPKYSTLWLGSSSGRTWTTFQS